MVVDVTTATLTWLKCIHFIGLFDIKSVEFTCMATWLSYKTACVSIINVSIIMNLQLSNCEKIWNIRT